MKIETFYDPATFTLSHLVYDESSKDAVVIDPVLDYDIAASTTSTTSADAIVAFVVDRGLRLHWVLETHAHADHLSASLYLKHRVGASVAISERIVDVQRTFKDLYDLSDAVRIDGGQFDRLLRDGETLKAGTLEIGVIATPGHTPACVSYRIEDAVFVGDALFIEDYGVGRCDFPKGSAADLYDSVHGKLYSLPDETRVFVGHDYQPGGRPLRSETTIGREKASNVQLKASDTKEDFVLRRTARDATLQAPRLLWPSIQVNVDAGRLPRPHPNGRRYLVVPLNLGRPIGDDGARTDPFDAGLRAV